jgi:tetratricopeptide (TPR) repeat protein
MAAAALQADDLEFARERVERAIELDPDWIKAKLLYARVMLLDGDADAAIDYTARIIGDDPDPDPDARMELALMYMTAGRDDDALSQVNQVLLERASRTDALRMMAIINFRQNNLDAAWDDFEDLLASGDYTADALYYLARISDYRGEHDRAIRLYSQVVTGNNAVTSQRRASALMAYQKDDPEAAIKVLDKFADSRPRYAVDMVLAKAQLLVSLDRYPEALEYYDQAVSYRPDTESVALGRAELLLRMDRLDDAISAYRAAAKRWPDSSITLNALGYTLADRTEEYRDAEKYIRKALKYDPDSAAIIDSLGWVLHKRGKHEEALEQLEIAYEQFPDHEVAAHLVEVLVVLERTDEALELLAAAELENPQSDLLSDVRERLFPEAP